MEKHVNRHNKRLDYLFTAIIVAALIAVYLLTGRRERKADAAEAEVSQTAVQPTDTPYGRPAGALNEDLTFYTI